MISFHLSCTEKMSVARQMRERMFGRRDSDDSDSDSSGSDSDGSSRSSSASSRGSRTARTPSPKIRVRSRSPPRNQGLSPLNQRAPVSALPKIPKWFPIPRSVRPDGTHLQPVPSRAVQPPKGFNLELAWDINSDTLCWKPVPEGEQVCENGWMECFVEVGTEDSVSFNREGSRFHRI